MEEPLTPPEPKTRPEWRGWAVRAAFESALIVFSVILALAVTNWADQRKTAAEVREARAYFVAEIRANRALLADDAFLPHHRRLREVFNATAGKADLTRADAVSAYGTMFETGLHLPPLRDAVWRSVQSGDLMGEMPLEEVFLLADVYAAQARVMRTHDGFVSTLPPILGEIERGEGLRAGVTAGQLSLGDVVASEEGLMDLYDKALARLDPRRPAATTTPGDAGRKGG